MAKVNTRKKKANKKKKASLHVIQPNAAGIDVGSTEIYVAVPHDRDSTQVKKFETFTEDLHIAAQWLKRCSITSIVMEWCRVPELIPTPVSDLFPTFSWLNYKHCPANWSIVL